MSKEIKIDTKSAIAKNQGEFNASYSNRFNDPSDLYIRFLEIKANNPKAKARENITLMYDRKPTFNSRINKPDANHGQFRMKTDNYMTIFDEFIAETPDRFSVSLTFEKDPRKKSWEDAISAAFKDLFIKGWECLYNEEKKTIMEMTLYGKGIHYWEEKIGYKSKSLSAADVYPNLKAGMNPSEWDLLFVNKEYSLNDLYDIVYGEKADANQSKGWNKEAVNNYLTFKTSVNSNANASAASNFSRVGISCSTMEQTVTFLHCYVKEYSGKNRISKFIIPADAGFLGVDNKENKSDGSVKEGSKRFIFSSPNYCECLSNVASIRTTNVTRSYWDSPSFAELIYLSCKLYDQATNAVIRAAIRNMTIFLSGGDSPDQADKLRKLGSSEIEVLEGNTKIEQNRIGVPVAEMTGVIRQIMFDAERHSAQSQSPGSQNVKGYAITAEEAQQRALDEDRSKSNEIRSLVAQDRFFWKETYRRAITNPSACEEDLAKEFHARMELLELTKDQYSPDKVLIEPVFNYGGSRSSKISFAQSLYSAVSIQDGTDAQKKAKRVLVAAHVGEENVEDYLDPEAEVKNLIHIQKKAGQENEDMDNPALNPENVPVSPDDKHIIEVMFHIKDYKFKLSVALKLFQSTENLPPAVKSVFLISAKDLITAQDNKGAHIEAHFKYISQDETINKDLASQAYTEFAGLRQAQDKMQTDIENKFNELIQSFGENTMLSEQLRHTIEMNKAELEHTSSMNNIALQKALEQKDLGNTKSVTKTSAETVHKDSLAKIEVEKQQALAQIEIQKKSLT
jgi:hypothetical protein